MDGPYGSPSARIFESSHAVFIGAGIGVTPFASVLESLLARAERGIPTTLRRVHFFWLNRDQTSFEWFVALLRELEKRDVRGLVDFHLCMTQGRSGVTALALEAARSVLHSAGRTDLVTGLRSHIHLGHPDWAALLGQIALQSGGHPVDVFFCGPAGLGAKLRPLCERLGMRFREERFGVPTPVQLPRPFLRLCAALAVFLALGSPATGRESSAPPRHEGDHTAFPSCHIDDERGASHPPHDGVLPTTCWVCHTQSSWRPSVRAHRFPLDGAHEHLRCVRCHAGEPPVYEGTGDRCVDCHDDRYRHNPLPWHAQFPSTCADCHTTAHWKPSTHPRALPAPEVVPESTPGEVDACLGERPSRRARRRTRVTTPVDVVTRTSQRYR